MKKQQEWFKVRYQRYNEASYKCVCMNNDIWMNYKNAKKEFDKLINPRIFNEDTILWVELSYFPEDAEDEILIEDWELEDHKKQLIKFTAQLAH